MAHQGHLDMSSTCNSAMAPWPWTVAMASLGRHHEASRPAWGSHVVPQTVAIATCMSTSMGVLVRIWHIEGNATSSVPQPYALFCTATRPHRHIAPGAAGGRYTNSVRAQALRLKPRAARSAHAGYLLTLAPASFVVRLSGLSYPALNYRRTPAPRPSAWHSHSRSNSHSPYAYAYTYTYICA